MKEDIPNIEQLRARNAIQIAQEIAQEKDEGDALSGFATLIINNGLLPTLAFALEKKGQHERICDALGRHIASMPRFDFNEDNKAGSALQKWLIDNDSFTLRQITAEIMAYLSYLKRYVRIAK
tara:strand:- start:2264 stop:2632 length:369 start_codon:yes stop_codon:yes gene_type:complete